MDVVNNLFYLAIAVGVIGLIFVVIAAKWVLKQDRGTDRMKEIQDEIQHGARAYLKRQYTSVGIFVIVVAIILGVAYGMQSVVAFVTGAFLSLLSGYLGMMIGTGANAQTAAGSSKSLNTGLRVAFFSGTVMGFSVVSLGILGLSLIFWWMLGTHNNPDQVALAAKLIPAFGFGASSVALFARVGGGIFTKSADVGADLVGKVEAGIPEDDPRNPAVIADNVGDNVGDIAGMGADLYESYVGSIIAPLTIAYIAFYASSVPALKNLGLQSMMLPFAVAITGIVMSLIATSFVHVKGNRTSMSVLLMALRKGVWGASLLTAIALFFVVRYLMGPDYIGLYYAILAGLVAGVIIGYSTEYYTSQDYSPTKDVSSSAGTGGATVIIRGMAVGMLSTVIPILTVGAAILVSYLLAKGTAPHADTIGNINLVGIYGVALAGIGMLATLGITLATDAYGPVADNAGGIATMAELDPEVRERTDALDSLGNTTAATGKGFAIGSAALTALGLTISVILVLHHVIGNKFLNMLSVADPMMIVGMFIGGMLPFLFCSFTLNAVGKAANAMVEEVRRQWREIKGLREGTAKGDSGACVDIATRSAQKQMIAPALIAVISPLLVGFLLGPTALLGLLTGSIVSGFLLAVMMANAGGSWDNAKKYIEEGNFGGKGSDAHKAAVIGDTVGDPFKDTSGPSLNILIKLMAVVSLVFAEMIAKNYIHW